MCVRRDSNPRSLMQWILSPPPLTTREPTLSAQSGIRTHEALRIRT